MPPISRQASIVLMFVENRGWFGPRDDLRGVRGHVTVGVCRDNTK